MKNFLTIALLISAFLIVGCGSDKNTENIQPKIEWAEGVIYASFERSCFCIVEARYVKGCIDAGHRKDIAYLEAMVNSDLAFFIRDNTKVLYADTGVYPGVVAVKFLEGEYKGKTAYTWAKRVQ